MGLFKSLKSYSGKLVGQRSNSPGPAPNPAAASAGGTPTPFYHSLDSARHEIRLLEAQSTSGTSKNKEQLVFIVHHVSLDEQPDYCAISYVWGDPDDTEPILVDGRPFNATKNLVAAFRALSHIRDRPRLIWADAISINQQDIPERNSQVTMMGSLYEQASKVFISLGPADPAIKAGFHILNTLASCLEGFDPVQLFGPFDPFPLIYAFNEALGAEETAQARALLTNSRLSLSQALAKVLVSPPYWTRAWTFQEYFLATDGYLVAGDEFLTLPRLLNFMFWLFKASMSPAVNAERPLRVSTACWDFFQQVLAGPSAIPLHNMIVTKYLMEEPDVKKEFSIVQVLTACGNREASDSRDMFFGLLAVLGESFPLQVDYSLSVEEVFTSAAVLLVTGGGYMQHYLLDMAGLAARKQPSVLRIPSWVPEWGRLETSSISLNVGANASAGFPDGKASTCLEPPIMRVSGVILDTIEGVKELPGQDYDRRQHDMVDELAKFWFDCDEGFFISHIVAGRSGDHLPGISRFTAFLSVFLENLLFQISRKEEGYPEALEEVAINFLKLFAVRGRDAQRVAELQISADTAGAAKIHLTSGACTWDEALLVVRTTKFDNLLRQKIVSAAQKATNYGYLRTRRGLIGRTRPGVRAGDLLCVLSSWKLMAVLRKIPEQNGYHLVSWASAPGFMQGEAWEWTLRENVPLQDFVIR